MTLAEILQNRFRADLRHRGAAYIEAERVSLVRVTPENVFGVVVDGVEYQTQLKYQESDIALFCTCEHFPKNKACKHLWATVLSADLEGYVNPAIRPGRLAPFVSRETTAPIRIDDLTIGGESDADFGGPRGSKKKATAAPVREVRLAPWESKLDNLRQEMAVPSRGGSRKAAVQERQIFYEIDLEASREAEKLVVQATQRQRRSSGQWGKVKPLKVRPGELDQIEHEDDRVFLAYLAGAIPERNNWSTQQAELHAAAHRFHLPYELGTLILPDICRSGRLTFTSADDAPPAPLEWDEGTPWELTVRVKRNSDGSGWLLTGALVRDDETLELSEVPLAVPGGFVVTNDSIALLRDFGAAEWMKMLKDEGSLSIPMADQHRFIDRLLDVPTLPRLVLPKELQLNEVRATPTPSLKIFTPSMARWKNDSLTAEVLFNYLGTEVEGRNPRWAIVQREDSRCIIRDRAVENKYWERLRELGFRKRLNGSETSADVEIPRRDLGRAVRDLVADGWEVFADGSKVRQAGSMKFRVQSDIDWFDVNAEIDFEGRTVSFPELLQALQRGDSTVRLDDGSLGILPEEWLEQIGMFSGLGTMDEDSLRFSNSQAALLDALLSSQDDVEFDEKFEAMRERFRSFTGIDQVEPPDSFQGTLRDYQRDGLSWMTFLRDFNFGGCLADDMGLGKTVQFIAMLMKHREVQEKLLPSLIVVPRSLIFNWMNECRRFGPKLKVLDYTGIDRGMLRENFNKQDIVLTTYGTVRRDIALLKDVEFDYVVLDEAQTIKNPSSQIARASRLLRARHRLALSGTPIENNAGDLWSIFEFLNPGMLGRSSAFRTHVSDPDSRESRSLVARGLRPFILRRTKQQVAAELPDRLEETIYCEMEEDQRRLYDELRMHYRDSLLGAVERDGLAKAKMHVLEALLRLRQAACHPALLNRGEEEEAYAKLEFLIPHLKELVAENHKSLVFSQFTSMLSIVRHHLDEAGIEYEYLDGQTRDRQKRVTRFQEDENCRVFLISLKAGGLGLNLTAADYVFLLDPWWNPAVEAQAIDRAHRVGQTRTVFAYRMICRDTVEEKIAELQKKKRDLADAILEGSDQTSILKDLSVEDLELLLS
ncbi:MAG: SNF2 helicase associated domain-containing protein [Planctomycetaceae bacterium]|nr:SNF2 helicase associated domain-containing protein [Planctomycetaceae bacterium]